MTEIFCVRGCEFVEVVSNKDKSIYFLLIDCDNEVGKHMIEQIDKHVDKTKKTVVDILSNSKKENKFVRCVYQFGKDLNTRNIFLPTKRVDIIYRVEKTYDKENDIYHIWAAIMSISASFEEKISISEFSETPIKYDDNISEYRHVLYNIDVNDLPKN